MRVRRGREKDLHNGSINTSSESQEQTAYTLNGGHQIVLGAKIGASGHRNIWSLATFRGTAGCDVMLHYCESSRRLEMQNFRPSTKAKEIYRGHVVSSYLIAYLRILFPLMSITLMDIFFFTMTVELFTITVGVPNSAK